MSSFFSTLEDLPDEILLLICRYLSSIDILVAFHGQNTRFSKTFSGYSRYVSLNQVSYKQLPYICSSILPKIGSNIHSLIVSDKWNGFLSKVFIDYFGERMSSIFPHLERLTFIAFTTKSLSSFLNCLKNLLELREVDIHVLTEGSESPTTILHQIFTANENRFTSISFDHDSIPFSLETEDATPCYPNIEKLTITLKTLDDLHSLLTILPRIHCLDASINNSHFEISGERQLLPVKDLKNFCLRAFKCSWDLDQLTTILNRIPNVEELSIKIFGLNDSRLVVGHEFFSQLSSLPLKVFNYVLFFSPDSSIDRTMILSNWQQYRPELIGIESGDLNGSILYTLPFPVSQLNISYKLISIVSNSDLIKSCGRIIKSLSLCDIPSHIAESYFLLTKCRRVKYLTISIDEWAESSKYSFLN
jgi:hypothetical protein